MVDNVFSDLSEKLSQLEKKSDNLLLVEQLYEQAGHESYSLSP